MSPKMTALYHNGKTSCIFLGFLRWFCWSTLNRLSPCCQPAEWSGGLWILGTAAACYGTILPCVRSELAFPAADSPTGHCGQSCCPAAGVAPPRRAECCPTGCALSPLAIWGEWKCVLKKKCTQNWAGDANWIARTFLRDGRAHIQVGRLVFDVLCKGENIFQLRMTMLQVAFGHLGGWIKKTPFFFLYTFFFKVQ